LDDEIILVIPSKSPLQFNHLEWCPCQWSHEAAVPGPVQQGQGGSISYQYKWDDLTSWPYSGCNHEFPNVTSAFDYQNLALESSLMQFGKFISTITKYIRESIRENRCGTVISLVGNREEAANKSHVGPASQKKKWLTFKTNRWNVANNSSTQLE
jgi:hypothetical protein